MTCLGHACGEGACCKRDIALRGNCQSKVPACTLTTTEQDRCNPARTNKAPIKPYPRDRPCTFSLRASVAQSSARHTARAPTPVRFVCVSVLLTLGKCGLAGPGPRSDRGSRLGLSFVFVHRLQCAWTRARSYSPWAGLAKGVGVSLGTSMFKSTSETRFLRVIGRTSPYFSSTRWLVSMPADPRPKMTSYPLSTRSATDIKARFTGATRNRAARSTEDCPRRPRTTRAP